MYRRLGGWDRPALTSPTDSPPDLDLLDFIDLDFTFNTPCLRESPIENPVKMKSNKTAPATLAIGSPQWMGDETKPFHSALQSLQGFEVADGLTLESLLADRGTGLNTPPPLPILSDLGDFIPPDEKLEQPISGYAKKEEERSDVFGGLSDTSGHSPLRDPSVENTVNLRDIFCLQDYPESAQLLQDLNPQPVDYLPAAELKADYQQLIYSEAAADREQLLYLPAAACQEEQIENYTAVEDSKPLQHSLLHQQNFIDHHHSGVAGSSAEILTLTEELYHEQVDDLDLIDETGHVLGEPVDHRASERVVWSGATPSGRGERKKSSSASGRKRRIASLDKESDEYKDKRARNNESVRRSRDKAKARQEETEERLHELSSENNRLLDRVNALEKELSVLRSLLTPQT